MNILVCVKRVPDTGAKMILTADNQAVDSKNLGFTVSPHEECAEEEAVRQVEEHGGSSWILTLGPEEAGEQLQEGLALGMDEAVLLNNNGEEWDPRSTSLAITEAVQKIAEEGTSFDVLLFGNEAADSGDFQVGVRVANALDLPVVTGVKDLSFTGDTAVAKRESSDGWEVYQVPLPAVFTVKEGINIPRYPSLRGRMQARRQEIKRITPKKQPGGLKKIRLRIPEEEDGGAEVLGEGPEVSSKVVDLFQDIGVV
ncbi:MAG: electron transfer flavoprotein subunit beta/FixA family protein [Anaerolineales bacterium]|nr:electron transfer flavoprotein subunit beta/FixA family protein [Anaerolineales bacterium]